MLEHIQLEPATAELAGDVQPLIEQLGSPGGLAALGGASGLLPIRKIESAADLRIFLENYHAQILQPLELPAIQRAFGHASRNELRELIAFDKQLSEEPLLRSFASASRLVGQAQLQRLRPLRDERLVQRYLAAVGRGDAQGWHTLVYGLTLAVYSLPLRQGLFSYAQQTTRGFIQSATRSVMLSKAGANKLFEELCAPLPSAVEKLLAQSVIS